MAAKTHYYLNPYGGNFGDELGVEIVQRLCGSRIKAIDLEQAKVRRSGVIALGSIFHYAVHGDVIWGTGINPTWQKRKRWKQLDIRAVRGPFSQQYIENILDYPCPRIYGDPALLTSIIFPEYRRDPQRAFGIIPHYWDCDIIKEMQDVMLPSRHWTDVIEFIVGCDLIISSSLHALIVAESFGIPARWWHSPTLKSTRTEGTFKYNDYYAATNRSTHDWASSINEAIRMGGKEAITDYDHTGLIESFPRNELLGI